MSPRSTSSIQYRHAQHDRGLSKMQQRLEGKTISVAYLCRAIGSGAEQEQCGNV